MFLNIFLAVHKNNGNGLWKKNTSGLRWSRVSCNYRELNWGDLSGMW